MLSRIELTEDVDEEEDKEVNGDNKDDKTEGKEEVALGEVKGALERSAGRLAMLMLVHRLSWSSSTTRSSYSPDAARLWRGVRPSGSSFSTVARISCWCSRGSGVGSSACWKSESPELKLLLESVLAKEEEGGAGGAAEGLSAETETETEPEGGDAARCSAAAGKEGGETEVESLAVEGAFSGEAIEAFESERRL